MENYCPRGKIQPWPTIRRGSYRAEVNSRPRLNFAAFISPRRMQFVKFTPLTQYTLLTL